MSPATHHSATLTPSFSLYFATVRLLEFLEKHRFLARTHFCLCFIVVDAVRAYTFCTVCAQIGRSTSAILRRRATPNQSGWDGRKENHNVYRLKATYRNTLTASAHIAQTDSMDERKRRWEKKTKQQRSVRQQQQHIDKRNPFLWLMAYIRFSIFSLIKLKRMGNNIQTKRNEKENNHDNNNKQWEKLAASREKKKCSHKKWGKGRQEKNRLRACPFGGKKGKANGMGQRGENGRLSCTLTWFRHWSGDGDGDGESTNNSSIFVLW